jgi:hypothetical protein
MKSLQEVHNDYFFQSAEEDLKPIAELREARAELDALLQRAGIKDGPDETFGDDADKWTDESYHRRRVREMVFSVTDLDFRRHIMKQLRTYRYMA